MRSESEDRRLPIAIAVSIGLHLLLMLLPSWPALSVRALFPANPAEDESIPLVFSFAQRPPERVPHPDAAAPAPTEPIPEAPIDLPAPEPVVEPGPEVSPVTTPDTLELPHPPEPAPPPTPAPSSEPERAFDLSRALRDFKRGAVESSPSRAPRRSFVPDLSTVPRHGFGAGNLEFESADFDWTGYAREIYWQIWWAWHRRLYESVNEFEKWALENGWVLHHENRVRFVIRANGDVESVVLETPSGCVPLDASAVDALTSVRLPPLPREFPRDRETVRFRFVAEGHIRGMRPTLSRLFAGAGAAP